MNKNRNKKFLLAIILFFILLMANFVISEYLLYKYEYYVGCDNLFLSDQVLLACIEEPGSKIISIAYIITSRMTIILLCFNFIFNLWILFKGKNNLAINILSVIFSINRPIIYQSPNLCIISPKDSAVLKLLMQFKKWNNVIIGVVRTWRR